MQRKKIAIGLLLAAIVLVFGIGIVYFFGIYTYFTEVSVDEAAPVATAPTSNAKSATDVTAPPSQPAPALQEPTGSTIRAHGAFVAVDRIHQGSGTASIIAVDGKQYLRFKNFSVTNGPDLHVYLSPSAQPTGELASLGTYKDLGLLKGNVGNQNYEIPGDIADIKTVVIWCKRFGVLFSYAVFDDVNTLRSV